MIVCNRCGKENQDNYKFCLGCGGPLVARGAAPVVGTAPAGPAATATVVEAPRGRDEDDDDDDDEDGDDDDDNLGATSVSQRAAAPPIGQVPPPARPAPVPQRAPLSDARAGGTPAHVMAVPAAPTLRSCPRCANQVPLEFLFCGQCGTRLGDPPAPSPRTVFAANPPMPAARGKLVLIRPDGNEGGSFPLHDGETMIGRETGPLFETDTYLSPRHALLILQGASLHVKDAGSLNGVFFKMSGEEEILDGEVFRMGQELLRFDVIHTPQPLPDGTEVMGSPNPGYWGRISVVIGRGQDSSAYPLFGDSVVVGRERGDILFPDDGYVSGTHARLVRRGGRFFLTDLNSSNGSFIRVREERKVPSGTFLLIGQQLFRIQYS